MMVQTYKIILIVLTILNLCTILNFILKKIFEKKDFLSNSPLILPALNGFFVVIFGVHSSYFGDYVFWDASNYEGLGASILGLVFLTSVTIIYFVYIFSLLRQLKDYKKVSNLILVFCICGSLLMIVRNLSAIIFNQVVPPLNALPLHRASFYLFSSQFFYFVVLIVATLSLTGLISEKWFSLWKSVLILLIILDATGMISLKIIHNDFYDQKSLKFIMHIIFDLFIFFVLMTGLFIKSGLFRSRGLDANVYQKISILFIFNNAMYVLIILSYKPITFMFQLPLQNKLAILIAILSSVITLIFTKILEKWTRP